MSAYKYYIERTKLKGDPEEDSITHYRLGVLTEKIGEINKNFTWQMAFDHYLKAYSIRPQRIEPLVMIGNHYLHAGEPALAYLFIRRACETSVPIHETQAIEPQMYNFNRYAIFARCAWQLGDYVLGEQAARLALKEQPDDGGLRELLGKYIKVNSSSLELR